MFQAEMASLMGSNPDCECQLTENECAMIITHAYKKVLRVQKELALVEFGMGQVPVKQCETIC